MAQPKEVFEFEKILVSSESVKYFELLAKASLCYNLVMKSPEQATSDKPKSARYEQYNPRELQELVSSNFDLPLTDFQRLPEEEHGDNSQVFFSTIKDERVIVKIGDNAHDFEIEDAILKLMNEAHVAAPSPINWKPSLSRIGKAVMIQTVLPGRSLEHTPKSKITPTIARETGELLRKMHSINIPRFGKLDVRDGVLQGRQPTFKAMIERDKLNHDALVVPGYISEEEFELLERIRMEISEIDITKASLVHYDFHPEHVFAHNGHVTGFIDFANAVASDPRTDIAKAHYEFPREFQKPFDEGYGELASDPMVSKLGTLFAAQKVIYRHEEGYLDRIPKGVKILKDKLKLEKQAS